MLIGCLLKAHGFKDSFISKLIGKAHEKESCMLMLATLL